MSTEVQDLRPTIVPKSDQLNAEQLLSGPIIITVTSVSVATSKEQPVTVNYENDGGRPYKPCLTMRKVLIHAWGPDGNVWIGRSMELFNEPSVKFGAETVGGIRISRLSDIPKDIKVSLTATKGKKAMHEIRLLKSSPELMATLEAIKAATNGESLKKAKALAAKLTVAADIEIALAAYTKKVAELKAGAPAASPPPPPTPSADSAALLSGYLVMIDTATDGDVATLALDEARDVLDAEDHAALTAAWRKRWAD